MPVQAPRLKAHFGYRKFTSPPYAFLFLAYDFFLQDSLIGELQRQGHWVTTLSLPKGTSAQAAMRELLRKAAEVRPDAVMALNGMGLDDQGQTVSVLSDLGIPVVIWYLDNHLFTGPHLQDRSADWAIAFTYERALESSLRAVGFQHVFYLPLATDHSLSKAAKGTRFDFLNDKISFVGGTFSKALKDYGQPDFEDIYHEWKPDFGSLKQASGRIDLTTLFAPYHDRLPEPVDFYKFMAYVIARETLRYRKERLLCLEDEPLVVFGPHDWKDHLPGLDLRPPAEYQTETPLIYRSSAINLSLTTLQQETALNQRYYDVPLCGGFLLGEWQEALSEHFHLDREVVFFRTDAELQDKTRYYLHHPAERRKIVERARKRILKEHLMEHRVASMLAMIRKVCDQLQ